MAYPVPARRHWHTQIEFLDGTIIDGSSDDDAIDRWARLSAWTDPDALIDRTLWLDKIVARARAFYGAGLIGIDSTTPATMLLDALAAEKVVILRRQ